jgi:hypothetical protein
MSATIAIATPSKLPADLDPALPHLQTSLDEALVAGRFARSWPGGGRAPFIKACRLDYLAWSPGLECQATYRLEIEENSGRATTVLGVVILRPDGVHDWLFTSDVDLAGVAAATNRELMQSWLSERLGRKVTLSSISPVRYRPGRRCVLRYELSGDETTLLYGKLLPGKSAELLASTVASLDDLAAPLVGTSSHWQLVVQADAGSLSLGSLGRDAGALEGLDGAQLGGQLLARLHGRQGPSGEQRGIADDIAEVSQNMTACERVAPEIGARISATLENIRERAGAFGSAVPSHGAFRLDQIHLSAAGPRLIDLDSFCWSDPARDLANLSAYLRWRAIRKPDLSRPASALQAAFLTGYATGATAPVDPGRLHLFEATSLLKIALRRYRRLKVEQWDRVPQLIDAASGCVAAGD